VSTTPKTGILGGSHEEYRFVRGSGCSGYWLQRAGCGTDSAGHGHGAGRDTVRRVRELADDSTSPQCGDRLAGEASRGRSPLLWPHDLRTNGYVP